MRLRPLLPGLLLLGAALAGCLSEPTVTTTWGPAPFDPAVLSPWQLKVRAAEEVWVTAADGTRLHNAVYRPNTTEEVPVFINFSPYWGDTAMGDGTRPGGDAFARHMVNEYVPRGYAVVLAAVRGTGHSEGCFQVGGDLEVRDAYEVIDYFATQGWSNGKVAAGGKSYDSTTQNGIIAKRPHPALRGVFHVSAITDMYSYNAKDGVVYQDGLDFTPRYFLDQGLDEYGIPDPEDPRGSAPPDPTQESPESLRRLAGDVACPEAARHVASGEGTAADGMRDAYWRERDWVSALPASKWNGSVFFVHGLQDWNVKPDNIDPWLAILQSKGIPVLGWLHQDSTPPPTGGHVYPMRQDWNRTMLRWLDSTLKGVDTRMDQTWGFESEGSDGTWRRSATWPPPRTDDLHWDAVAGPPPRSDWPAKVRVAGVPYALVTVEATDPDAIARVILYDEAPDGGRTFVSEAVRRIALSDDLAGPRGSTGPVLLNLTFFPVDHLLGPGHTWYVDPGASPSDGPDGGTTPPGFFFRPDQVSSEAVEYVKIEMHLPSVDAAGVVVPQPEPMAHWAGQA